MTFFQDDGIRPTTLEALTKLRPAFKKDGTTTAGNSSQVSDGAAAVIAMTRAEAKRRGLKVIGKFHSFAVVGVPPSVMGIGPAYAIPAALKQAGLTVDDIDVYEINEAFASQALYSVRKVGIPPERVNPNGGAIALGHPLGCTGARQISTLLHQLRVCVDAIPLTLFREPTKDMVLFPCALELVWAPLVFLKPKSKLLFKIKRTTNKFHFWKSLIFRTSDCRQISAILLQHGKGQSHDKKSTVSNNRPVVEQFFRKLGRACNHVISERKNQQER